MSFKKLINLKVNQKKGLEEIQKQVSENQGNVSLMVLIVDAIDIFINFYSKVAVEKYSPLYKTLEGENYDRR